MCGQVMRALRPSGLVGSNLRARLQASSRASRQPSKTAASNPSSITSRTFTSNPILKAINKPPVNNNNNNFESTKFSLDGLGISRNMKIGLIVIFCILGTLETITYTRWAYMHFFADKNKEQDRGIVSKA